MIKDYITDSLSTTEKLLNQMAKDADLIDSVSAAINVICNCLQNDNKLMFCGNGGSAADAQHMSAEFVARFDFERPALAAIALTTDTSALTAIGNDYGFDRLFARQIEALGKKGDVLIAYSTSGSSKNILQGMEIAREKKITCIGLTGRQKQAEAMVTLCDIAIQIPSESTPRIQEGHLAVGHILCGCVEKILFS